MPRIPIGIWLGMVFVLLGVLTRDKFGIGVGAVLILITLVTVARRDRPDDPDDPDDPAV